MGIQILHPAAGDFRLARKDRAIILGVASAVLAVCLWLIVQTAWPGKGHGGRVGPSRSQSRKARHFSTREATLVQAGATLVTAILCIVGTVQNILANRFLCAFLSSCQALIQGKVWAWVWLSPPLSCPTVFDGPFPALHTHRRQRGAGL